MYSEFSICNDSSTVSKALEELQIIHVVLSVVNTRHRLKDGVLALLPTSGVAATYVMSLQPTSPYRLPVQLLKH